MTENTFVLIDANMDEKKKEIMRSISFGLKPEEDDHSYWFFMQKGT